MIGVLGRALRPNRGTCADGSVRSGGRSSVLEPADARGFTLLELTIILAVIAILGLILAPSIVQFLNQSRLARARNDVQVLADAVLEFFRDNGFFPQYTSAVRNQTVRLLVSPGAVGEAAPGSEAWTVTDPGLVDLISNQLVANRPLFGAVGYPLRTASGDMGWNGPYVAAEPGPDPWGNRYAINVEFLSLMPGAFEADAVQQKRAVWALSAGPDGVWDTRYPDRSSQLISSAAASPTDISARIQ